MMTHFKIQFQKLTHTVATLFKENFDESHPVHQTHQNKNNGSSRACGVNTHTKAKIDLNYFGFSLFSSLFPYRYYDEADELFINENTLGFGLELSVLCGANEKIIHGLSDLLRFKIEESYDVQFTLWGSREVGEQIDRAFVNQYQLGGMYRSLADISQKYYRKAAESQFKNPRDIPLTLRDYRVFCFVSKRTKYNQRALDEILQLRTSLEAELKAASLSFFRIKIESFLKIVRSWLHPSQHIDESRDQYDVHESIHRQIVDPSFELIHDLQELTLEFEASKGVKANNDKGNQLARFQPVQSKIINLSLKELPDKFALWMSADNFCNILHVAQSIRCPFLISFYIKLIPQHLAKNLAQDKYRELSKKASSPYARIISGTTDAAQEWKKIRDELDKDDIRLAKTYFNLMLFSNARNQKRDESAAISSFRYNGIELFNSKYLQLQSYLSSFPFLMSEGLSADLERFGRLKKLTTWNAANLLPLVADFKGSKSGVLLPTFRHQIAFFDPFDEGLGTTNANIAVAATSGAGKSFLVQTLIMNILAQGGQCWVIDVGESYKKFCETVGGTYLTHENLKLNPFAHVTNIQESSEKIRDLLAVLASPAGNLSEVQCSYLLEAVLAAWHRKERMATIDDVLDSFIDFVNKEDLKNGSKINSVKEDVENRLDLFDRVGQLDTRLKDIIILLQKYTRSGHYGKIFNEHAESINPASAKSTMSPTSKLTKLTVLELGGLKAQPDLLKAVLFANILLIEEAIYDSPRDLKKMVVLDEAWQFLSGDNVYAARFIEKGYRTTRRHGGSFVTITQSVNDFHQSKESEAAWNCSDIKIIMRQNAKAFEDFIADHDGFYSPYEQALIKTFGAARENGFSEFMLQIGAISSFHRLFVDPFSRVMYSSSGQEFEAVERLRRNGLSIVQAIDQVARTKYQEEFL